MDADLGRAMVITVSTRAAAGEDVDETGPVIVARLKDWGFHVYPAVIVPDGDGVAAALRVAVDSQLSLIMTTGGTGLSPTDRTPEATMPLLEYQLPWLGEAMVRRGIENGVPTAMLTRGVAGVTGQTLIINLPGSKGAVDDGLAALELAVPHAVHQLHGGGDHIR